MARQPLGGLGRLNVRGFTITLETHHTQYDSSGRVTSSSQRPLPDNTQHSQETDIHAPGGIRTRKPSKRAAADPRLRLRSHWDRRLAALPNEILNKRLSKYGTPITAELILPVRIAINVNHKLLHPVTKQFHRNTFLRTSWQPRSNVHL
jgi:hypothetical protein